MHGLARAPSLVLGGKGVDSAHARLERPVLPDTGRQQHVVSACFCVLALPRFDCCCATKVSQCNCPASSLSRICLSNRLSIFNSFFNISLTSSLSSTHTAVSVAPSPAPSPAVSRAVSSASSSAASPAASLAAVRCALCAAGCHRRGDRRQQRAAAGTGPRTPGPGQCAAPAASEHAVGARTWSTSFLWRSGGTLRTAPWRELLVGARGAGRL